MTQRIRQNLNETKPNWPPTRADYRKALLLLLGCVVLTSIVGTVVFLRDNENWDTSYVALYAALYGIIAGGGMWLFLVGFCFLPLRLVPYLTARKEQQGRERGNASRGRVAVISGLWIYAVLMCLSLGFRLSIPEPKHPMWELLFALIALFLLGGVARGYKQFRDVVSYMLLMHGIAVLSLPNRLPEGARGVILIVQVIVGLFVGLSLLLSRDVNLYLALQFEKEPGPKDRKVKKGRSSR